MVIVWILLGFAAGAALVFFLCRRNAAKTEALLAVRESELALLKQQSDSEKTQLSSAFEREKQLMLQHFESEKKIQETSSRAVQEHFEKTLLDFEKSSQTKMELMESRFKELSEKFLKEKAGSLSAANKEQLELLLVPLREKMAEFRKSVEDSKTKGIEMNAALSAQIDKLMQETGRIGGEARDLANALRGGSKTQGDWGEMILSKILQSSGLVEGVHYETQPTLRDPDGKTLVHEENHAKMRPDVIVHYPDNKDVIIDSKVSLTAYAEYMNAEDEPSRKAALERHLKSVNDHVTELQLKNYEAYLTKSGRDTVDFVVMFIPNEGPFHLAMISDPLLWNEAFKKRVLIVSPTNLMALLKIIHIAWTREEQNRNQQDILATAGQLLDRLYAFYKEMDELGDSLQKVRSTYENALHRLKKGERTQSVVSAGEKLKKLGVKMTRSKDLPARLQLTDEPESGAVAEELPLLQSSGSENP